MTEIAQEQEDWASEYPELELTGHESSEDEPTEDEPTTYEWRGMETWACRVLFEGSEPIKVIVGTGDQQKTWYLPKKVLTRCSPFFDAALNGKFVEASSKVINLPEDNPIAFEIWVTWLSLGKCKDLFGTDYDNDYVRAWTLGDKLACPAFQDHVMFQFLSWWVSGEGLYLDTIKLAYEVSSPGSKLRHLFIDWFAWNKRNGSLRQELDEYVTFLREQTEFSEDVVVREVEAGSNIGRSPFKEKHRYYENPAFDPHD